jgi:hypothetical protein
LPVEWTAWAAGAVRALEFWVTLETWADWTAAWGEGCASAGEAATSPKTLRVRAGMAAVSSLRRLRRGFSRMGYCLRLGVGFLGVVAGL